MPTAANFFEPQAVKGAAVYFMRLVLHDWNNVACKKILTNLRAAALPSTKLVLFEAIMPHACPGTGPYAYATRMGKEDPPYPLLANLGVGGGFATMIDMQVCICYCSRYVLMYNVDANELMLDVGADGWPDTDN